MKRLLTLSLFITGLSFPVQAQQQEIEVDAVTQIVSTQNAQALNFADLNKTLTHMEAVLKSGQVSNSNMSEYVKSLSAVQAQLQDYRKGVDSDLIFSQKKIDALGDAPKEGETEPEIIAQKRQEFSTEYQNLKARLAAADIAVAKIDELESLILNVRNRELFTNLLNKQAPLVYPAVLLKSTALSVEFFIDIIKSPFSWYSYLADQQKDLVKSNLLYVSLATILIVVIGIYLRLFIMRTLGYRVDEESPRYASKVIAAFFVALARGILPALILIAFLAWIHHGQILTIGFFGLVLTSTLQFLLWTVVLCAFSRVMFAPYYERWRLINVETYKAKKLTKAFYFAIIASGLSTLCLGIATKSNYSQDLIYFLKVVSVGVKAFSIAWLVKVAYIAPQEKINEEESAVASYDEASEEDAPDCEETSPQAKIEFLVSLFSTLVFLVGVFGYPNLALYIINHVIATAVIIGVFLVLRKAIKEVSHRLLLTQLFSRTFRFRRRMVEKVDFWTGLIIEPILSLVALFIILTMWGVSTDLLLQSTIKFFTGFKVGGVTISLVSIFTGIIAFVVCLLLIKLLRRRIRKNVLVHMDIDEGIKHSLDSGFGFVGIIVSILVGIVVMGGNLSSLAIIAGALSVGIGFGLQSIVNNLVSGFILLFERPIKIGDWVIIDGKEGVIKQINIRATIIETWDKANVVIPNATVLSSNLMNMTLHDKFGRAEIKVGVAYGTDSKKVEKILLEVATKHPKVMKNPAPYVVLTGFGESSLDFELRAYISDVMSRLSISSELRMAIKTRFEEERIEMPFPQRVLHTASQNSRFLDMMTQGIEPSHPMLDLVKELHKETDKKEPKKK